MSVPLTKQKQERLTFIPLTVEENQMSISFKRLAQQDETSHHDLLIEALQLLFVKHNLDLGGNPQRQLFSFTADLAPMIGKCMFAGCEDKQAVGKAAYIPNGRMYQLCKTHMGLAKNNPKNWRL
jgi:hypothetical protein